MPFTLLSVVANQANDDYIVLTGLKDCYIMYLSENGQTKQEIIQQNQQSASNAVQPAAQKASNLPVPGTNGSGLIVLHPSLEGSNYIIKSLWLPGSKTELALVTSDFIKIYDLSIDKISPLYYYLLPMGKIKDVTFVYNTVYSEDSNGYPKQLKYIVIMSSCGYLYYEEMNDISSAKNGIYYVTNTIEIDVSFK